MDHVTLFDMLLGQFITKGSKELLLYDMLRACHIPIAIISHSYAFLFCFFFETESLSVALVVLELARWTRLAMKFRDSPTCASRSARIKSTPSSSFFF